jgi:hypothetical protein
MGFNSEKASIAEIMRTLDEDSFGRGPEFIRALVPACQSLVISVRLGIKLLERDAAVSWSVEHMFCNFDIGTPSTPVLCLLRYFSTAVAACCREGRS